MQPLAVRLGGNGGIDELRLCANPRSPAYVRADDVQAARICAASEPYTTRPLEAPASQQAAPDPNAAPASARWLAATSPAAYVPPALLEELLGESLAQEAQTDALCGNALAVLRLPPTAASAPALLAFHPAGRNGSTLSAQLVFPRAGGDVGVQALAELPLGALPLRQVVLAPGGAVPGRLLATRGPYRTEFLAVAANQEALAAVRFSRAVQDGVTPVAMRSVGYVASQMRVAHVEWSPHLEGDAAVISEDGSLQLFDVPADARSRAAQLRGSQVCAADGAPLGWRGCVFGAHPRTLLCASAATIWLADARSPPGAPRVVHVMAGGRPTAECFTALCSAEASGSSFMFGAATGSRILLFDLRRAQAPLLSWEHWLGADDPPRILSCQSAQPWMPDGSPESGCFLVASNLGRREAAAFQFSAATPSGSEDTIGWASQLLRTRIGARAIGSGMRLPSVNVHRTGVRLWHGDRNVADHGNSSWNISDPPAAGFAMLEPVAGGRSRVGILCNSYGADGLAAVLCAHAADASEEWVNTDALAKAGPASVVSEKPAPRQHRRALLDAAQTSRTLPLHFALLSSSHIDPDDAAQPHPDATPAVEAVQQSLWPVTLLEAAHVASMHFHGQTASLRGCAVLSAASAGEGGNARKAGKSFNPARRRAAVAPLLRESRASDVPLLSRLPAPHASGAIPVVLSSHKALLDAVYRADGGLLHTPLPTLASPVIVVDDHRTSTGHGMDETVLAPGAGHLHCAAFRASWATCSAWGAELACDPTVEVFCPGQHVTNGADMREPRLDLPPPPADADSAALQELARRWPEPRVEPLAAAAEQVPDVGAAVLPDAAAAGPPGAKQLKKRSRRDGF